MSDQILSCPVCQQPLTQLQNNLRCNQGHSFDKARQGYWNLLLANKKRSKDPGDNAEMVIARQQFLSKGYYEPLSNTINQLAIQQLAALSHSTASIVDIGCGEGYYSNRLDQALTQEAINHQLTGLDISKHAVKLACKRNKSIQWLVASGAQIPVADQSQDIITLLFCRLMPEALARAIKPKGHLIMAWPAENHLIELRTLIYQQIKSSDYNPEALLKPLFQLQHQDRLSFEITLQDQSDIQALLQMTPHSQRMPEENRARLNSQPQLTLSVDINIGLFQRL